MIKRTIADYPLAENQAHTIKGPRGKALPDITLEAVISGEVEMQDLRIMPDALRAQAEIAEAANRSTLAQNFNRAAELVNVPQDVIMATYELLRPGRAKSKEILIVAAQNLRATYGAHAIAEFIEEAAAVYEQRGLFTHRF
jgi:propanediol dehydratase small subunit